MTREWLLRCHRYLGLLLALFVVTNGLTGSLLAFNGEIDNRLNADVLAVHANDSPLSADALTEIVQAHYPQARITGFFFGDTPDLAHVYTLKSNGPSASPREVWIDPYTGQIRGDRDMTVVAFDRRHLMPTLHKLHSTLLLGATGEAILATVAAGWFVTLLIGLYLAWPRNGSWRKIFAVKRDGSRFRLWFDLHRALGSAVLLILLSTTLCATYLTAPKVVRAIMAPVAMTTGPVLGSLPKRAPQPAQITPEQAIARVQRMLPDATVRGMYFHPEKGAYQLRVRLADDINVRNGTGRYFVDSRNGAVISTRSYKQGGTPGDRVLTWLFPLHSGQALGWFGRILICLTGLVAPLLAISGIYIYLRKRLARAQRQRVSRPASA